jgi:hypothetical protein
LARGRFKGDRGHQQQQNRAGGKQQFAIGGI